MACRTKCSAFSKPKPLIEASILNKSAGQVKKQFGFKQSLIGEQLNLFLWENDADFENLDNPSPVNEKTDRKTYESWKKLNNTTYLGCGFTIKNNDTISQEHLTITKIDEKWILKVKLDKTKDETTDFELIRSDKNTFTVENQKNDFPKIIKYWKNGTFLNAEISNDESNKVPFIFEKIN